uniref:Uncharacterized protein n=1 Tax=Lepeophtheirus salmonis TaxID=72036 RepID=A0A0K2UN43_LEPSM
MGQNLLEEKLPAEKCRDENVMNINTYNRKKTMSDVRITQIRLLSASPNPLSDLLHQS